MINQDLLNGIIILGLIGMALSSMYVTSYMIYEETGRGKKFFHDILNQHCPDPKTTRIGGYEGDLLISRCKFCGKKILAYRGDSWFEA